MSWINSILKNAKIHRYFVEWCHLTIQVWSKDVFKFHYVDIIPEIPETLFSASTKFQFKTGNENFEKNLHPVIFLENLKKKHDNQEIVVLNIPTLLSFLTLGFVLQVSCWASHGQRAWLRSSVQRTARSASTWPWFILRSPPLSAHVPNNQRGLRPACVPPPPDPPTSTSVFPVCQSAAHHLSTSHIQPLHPEADDDTTCSQVRL